MKVVYSCIFICLGLDFCMVQVDLGVIGGDVLQEFYVIVDFGEDVLVFFIGLDYVVNMEVVVVVVLGLCLVVSEVLCKVDMFIQKICEVVVVLFGLGLECMVKLIVIMSEVGFVLVLVCGDYDVNEIKLVKVVGLQGYCMVSEVEIVVYLGSEFGFFGLFGLVQLVCIVVDCDVVVLVDFVIGVNEIGVYFVGVNWGCDLFELEVVDICNVKEGDCVVDGGELRIVCGIEVGYVFQFGCQYVQVFNVIVLDENGKVVVMVMGCYGVGILCIVVVVIEQNYDDVGIIWFDVMVLWQVVVCVINFKQDEIIVVVVVDLFVELQVVGLDVVLDDCGLCLGVMFVDMELIGVLYCVVVFDCGFVVGIYEYWVCCVSEVQYLDWVVLMVILIV